MDAGNSEVLTLANSAVEGRTLLKIRAVCAALDVTGRIGLIRMFDPFAFRRESSAGAERSAALMYGAQPWRVVCAVVRGARKSLEEFARERTLRSDVPLVALSAERPDGFIPPGALLSSGAEQALLTELPHALLSTSQHLAQGSTRGSWRLVHGSGHLIAGDRPAAVVDAVLEMFRQVRAFATTAPHS